MFQLMEDKSMIRQWPTIKRKRKFVALYLKKNAFAYEDEFGDMISYLDLPINYI